MKFTVMVSNQGTACKETALCAAHDTLNNRALLEEETQPYGRDRGVRWKTGVENDELECTVCGAK